jgi:hypothetical protein
MKNSVAGGYRGLRRYLSHVPAAVFATLISSYTGYASDRLNILDYGPGGAIVDRSGKTDVSAALGNVVTAANLKTAKGEPACIYLPAGTYRIVTAPPAFINAGCVQGDGPSQATILLDPHFKGDLFSWSEAWYPTMPGPLLSGLKVLGSRNAADIQNAFVFYDRNDDVFIDNVEVWYLHGRALYSGVKRNKPQAYMRESHLRSLRFFEDGAPGVPVVEFSSEGTGDTDATNEVRVSQLDIFGPNGPGLVIRNNGNSAVRNITFDELRIEGYAASDMNGDLLTIGDPVMIGNVNNLMFSNVELIDPYTGYAAIRLTAPPKTAAPYQITFQGFIGGGVPRGQGLRIDAGRASTFHFSGIHTFGTNVWIGPGVSFVVIDGGGQEATWSYRIDPTSLSGVHTPVLKAGNPNPN